MDKKTFMLNAIKPYIKDPSLCGWDANRKMCVYMTEDGRKCVFGKFLNNPEVFAMSSSSASKILKDLGEGILILEATNILSPDDWSFLQSVHDTLAKQGIEGVRAGFEKYWSNAEVSFEELMAD